MEFPWRSYRHAWCRASCAGPGLLCVTATASGLDECSALLAEIELISVLFSSFKIWTHGRITTSSKSPLSSDFSFWSDSKHPHTSGTDRPILCCRMHFSLIYQLSLLFDRMLYLPSACTVGQTVSQAHSAHITH